MTPFLSRLVKDPLIHFLILGAVIFAALSINSSEEETISLHINVTEAEVNHLTENWRRQWQRPPTKQELSGLIQQFIREEVLYREAKRLRLDQDDIIIRRRLAQKMAFLSEDLVPSGDPGDEQLQSYFDENQSKYVQPARFSFDHIFFSAERRDRNSKSAAEQVLSEIDENTSHADLKGRGDAFMMPLNYRRKSEKEIARNFGKVFAASVTDMTPNEWTIAESSFGHHLVRVSETSPQRLPPLAEVRRAVAQDWRDNLRRQANEAVFEELSKAYAINIDESAINAAISGAAPGQ